MEATIQVTLKRLQPSSFLQLCWNPADHVEQGRPFRKWRQGNLLCILVLKEPKEQRLIPVMMSLGSIHYICTP